MKIKGKTIGEVYGLAMSIQTQAEADEYFEALIQKCRSEMPDTPREEAEKAQRSNLAYFAGYYDNETRERVERLFKCAHPVFVSIAKNGTPTPDQAFKMGQEMGEKMRKKHE